MFRGFEVFAYFYRFEVKIRIKLQLFLLKLHLKYRELGIIGHLKGSEFAMKICIYIYLFKIIEITQNTNVCTLSEGFTF